MPWYNVSIVTKHMQPISLGLVQAEDPDSAKAKASDFIRNSMMKVTESANMEDWREGQELVEREHEHVL